MNILPCRIDWEDLRFYTINVDYFFEEMLLLFPLTEVKCSSDSKFNLYLIIALLLDLFDHLKILYFPLLLLDYY